MSEMVLAHFYVILSARVNAEEVANALLDLVRPGCRLDVRDDFHGVDFEEGTALFATVHPWEDPAWPTHLNVSWFTKECGLQPFADLRIAEHLCKRFQCNAFCECPPFVDVPIQGSPFWSVAHVNGQWHLADDSHMSMDGTADHDDDGNFIGFGKLELVRKVEIPW